MASDSRSGGSISHSSEVHVDENTRQKLINQHLEEIRKLQAQADPDAQRNWPPQGYYFLWHVVVGMMLGFVGAAVSLVANIVGAPIFGEPAFKLIRVYLTFPMGEKALTADEGVLLTVGCILYLVTGALYGIAFHLVMSAFFNKSNTLVRFIVATLIGVTLWVVNFYAILSWLQPTLLGGNWIIEQTPIWVAVATHVAFAWTMFVIESFGKFEPYRLQATAQKIAAA